MTQSRPTPGSPTETTHLDAERALEMTIMLEGLLGRMGAQTRGLGSRARELKDQLGERLYEDLRYVAWARNQVAHENPRFLDAEERKRFEMTVNSCRAALEKMTGGDPDEEPLEQHDVVSMTLNLERMMHAKGISGGSLRERLMRHRELFGRELYARMIYVASVRERYDRPGQGPLRGEERRKFIDAAEEAARQVSMLR